jgi:hypothetical protein
MGVVMLKSVGLSEYIHLLRAHGSELDLLIVEFLGPHTVILEHLVPSPYNLFATLVDLTTKMVAFLLVLLTLASFQLDLYDIAGKLQSCSLSLVDLPISAVSPISETI